jgi:NADH oxidase (H2O-forming)
MAKAVAVASGVHWIGALDPGLREFDIILRTPNGTSYNAWCVRGTGGVAVIDTVKASHASEFFARLEQVADYAEITAIVLNHLEPDHSGALPELMRRAPQARLYLSPRARPLLPGVVPDLDSDRVAIEVVTTGDRVDLGGRTLTFLHTPYLHWPDTQCTWLDEGGILFSGDIFGCHFCDERLFNDRVGDFRFSFEYYYRHIMRPFRRYLLEALEIIDPLPIATLAPAHGPILRHEPRHYLQRYRQLAQGQLMNEAEQEKTLLIFYISAYGNTARMAAAIRDGAEEVAGVRVSLLDLQGCEVASVIDLIEECDGLLFGSPTLNGDAVQPVWALLSSLAAIAIQGKLGGAFGSYGWSGEAVSMIEDRLRGLKLRVPMPGIRSRLVPDPAAIADCHKFGHDLALHLVGLPPPRTLTLEDLNSGVSHA